MTSWDEFTAGLAEVVSLAGDGATLVLSFDGDSPDGGYAQFQRAGDVLTAELHVPGERPYPESDGEVPAALLRSGWSRPPRGPRTIFDRFRRQGGGKGLNWLRSLALPTDAGEARALAAAIAAGLRFFCGADSPDELRYRAWTAPTLLEAGRGAGSGPMTAWPQLGIAAEAPAD